MKAEQSLPLVPNKGLPFATNINPGDMSNQSWDAIAGDLPFPLLLLKDSALQHNISAMAAWCAENGFWLAPHGKTTMCPQIHRRQVEAGAWAITVANVFQAGVCARNGIERIFIANQVVGQANIRSLAGLMREFPSVECFCLADSIEGVRHLASGLREARAERSVQVLLECGRRGWRTGVQSIEQAREVHSEILKHASMLTFRGIEGFEGMAHTQQGGDADAAEAREFIEFIATVGEQLQFPAANEPSDRRLLFSIGGSAYLDVVWEAFERLGGAYQPVLRSGCYVSHDHGQYKRRAHDAARRRQGRHPLPEFHPALELWSSVQSLPEEGVAILNFGKRDCSFDLGLPVPLFVLPQAGGAERAQPLEAASITRLSDQHAFLSVPSGLKLRIADRVCCGISHPCTAFDKWRVIPLVDDCYKVLDLYQTFF